MLKQLRSEKQIILKIVQITRALHKHSQNTVKSTSENEENIENVMHEKKFQGCGGMRENRLSSIA